MSSTIEVHSENVRRVAPSAEFSAQARVQSLEQYQALHKESLDEPDKFWTRESAELHFRKPWNELVKWEPPHAQWFVGAELNVSESCLDQHLTNGLADKAAIIWESEDGLSLTLSYAELHARVCELASGLRSLGIKSGDRVAIYMGMCPEAVIGMLACARIGAPHTVVFGGFASDSLRDRILDCEASCVLTQDGAPRRGKVIPLKATVDTALSGETTIQHVVVYRRMGDKMDIEMQPGRDVDWQELTSGAPTGKERDAEVVDAEHPLFILYTSGSTGKPKGILHSSAGYLVGTHVTTKYVFDLRPDDVYWCTADVGWITGHSYLVYGPLSNGATCLMYEGAPNHPDWGRFWQIIERHKVSILYTAPTAIRAFIKAGDHWLEKADLSSLRLLGSVGEPINPEAWNWYHAKVGGGRCPIVDTWWQTETGSIMTTTLPGAASAKPGATGLPFFGVEADVVDSDGNSVDPLQAGRFVVRRPWPSMLRSIWGDKERFQAQYFSDVPGAYFTGDGAYFDDQGYFQVVGRIDDVLNVSGHRLGTAEIESSLVSHESVAEAAAVGRPDDLTGQALVVFVVLKPGFEANDAHAATLKEQVAGDIGKFARPEEIRFADGLPKTRSGKIIRRLLKDVAAGQEITGDLSTLEDQSVLESLLAGR